MKHLIISSVPNKEIHASDHFSIINSFLSSFKRGCIYSDSEIDVSIISCIFIENTNFEKGSCMHLSQARNVLVDKCFAYLCHTNYKDNDSVFIVGQFSFISVTSRSGNKLEIDRCSFSSCAPDLDEKSKRRSTLESKSPLTSLNDINFSYNNLFYQVLYINGSGALNYVTFYRNTIYNYFHQDLRDVHENNHVQYLNNSITSDTPILHYAKEKSTIEMNNCVFLNKLITKKEDSGVSNLRG